MKSSMIGICMGFGLLLAAPVSQAAFVSPSWTRPANDSQANGGLSTYQQWNIFTSTLGPNAPDVAEVNPLGVANAYDSASPGSGAFLTGGGNIYSFGGVIEPRAIVPAFASGQATKFLVQVKSQGSLIDTNDLTLDGVLVSTLAGYSYSELTNVPLGGMGGSAVEHAWTFTAPVGVASFQLDWGWGVLSSSLDIVSIDTQTTAVPEPATWVLAAVGLVGVARARALARRRRR